MTRTLEPLCDKIGRERVATVVTAFYRAVDEDAVLAPFFAAVPDRAAHERRVTDFWWIAMGGWLDEPPVVNMAGIHTGRGIRDQHVARWLDVFRTTLHRELPPELAEAWATMAEGIGARLRASITP